MATPTHGRRNAFADGTRAGVGAGGLTRLGQDAVRRINEPGIVIDLAHLNIAGCRDVLERSEHPGLLSHNSPCYHYPEDAAGPGYRGKQPIRRRGRCSTRSRRAVT